MYIKNDYVTKQRHIAGLRRQLYTTGSGGKIVYQIIHDNEAFINSLLSGNEDGYPLRKEVKRDRYVLNSDAMRKTMQEATKKALDQFERQIVDYVQRDVFTIVEQTTTDALNSIMLDGTSFSPSGKQKPSHD